MGMQDGYIISGPWSGELRKAGTGASFVFNYHRDKNYERKMQETKRAFLSIVAWSAHAHCSHCIHGVVDYELGTRQETTTYVVQTLSSLFSLYQWLLGHAQNLNFIDESDSSFNLRPVCDSRVPVGPIGRQDKFSNFTLAGTHKAPIPTPNHFSFS